MQLTSIMSRSQQKRQLDLAEEAALPYAKGIALLAASVWGKEASAAERREQRPATAKARLVVTSPTDDRIFSENPDRGFADSACRATDLDQIGL
jgi:hypothetical protein